MVEYLVNVKVFSFVKNANILCKFYKKALDLYYKKLLYYRVMKIKQLKNNKLQNCLTHEVEIIGWPPND